MKATRCSNCHKFTSVTAPALTDWWLKTTARDASDTTVEGRIRIDRNCKGCNCTVKFHEFEVNSVANIIHTARCREADLRIRKQEPEMTVKVVGAGMAKKTWYGYQAKALVECLDCEASVVVQLTDTIQASLMTDFD